MATEKRLIAFDPVTFESFTRHCTKHREPYDQYDMGYVDAVENIENWMDANTVDAVEVVHSRFVRIADFGDGEGCFGYCEKCGTVHHAQSPVALKADHRWCRWCGTKMDGDGNG